MIELIPAIDIINGQCVRLTKGNYNQKTIYRDSPVEVAEEFEEIGFRRLHMVDLDGAKSKHIVNSQVLRHVTEKTHLIVDFDGGIKTDEDIKKAFDSGASMVTVGSIAVTNPELFMGWLEKYGADRMILGADVRDRKISINGWKEDSTEDLLPFLRKYIDAGVKNVLCTDISKDGMLMGPNVEATKALSNACGLDVIASGGVSSLKDLELIQTSGVHGAIIGKALYENRVNLASAIEMFEKKHAK